MKVLPKHAAVACALAMLAGLLPAEMHSRQRQRLPRRAADRTAAVMGQIRDADGRAVAGVNVTLQNRATRQQHRSITNAEGVFRVSGIAPGEYRLQLARADLPATMPLDLQLRAGELRTITVGVSVRIAAAVPGAQPLAVPPSDRTREVERRSNEPLLAEPAATPVVEMSAASPMPNRWEIAEPVWDRYGHGGPYPYTRGRVRDPYNRNKLKGDYPVIGQRTFLNLQLSSDTLTLGRKLPVPSNVSAANPGSEEFFGRGEQFFASETIRATADLFHGATAFRPFDWRLRVTPAVNINYLNTREQGIVNVDVRRGTNRTDWHAGLQEAFFEAKLADLSPNYDFLSVRAGIQPFSSDFRGFIFVDEQPGVRLFGNFFNNRWEYNLAYFYLLEKDTNSVLNKFQWRRQQVAVANLYVQDFLVRGYTAQFSVHLNRDTGTMHFDENGFLVRPAPIGAVAARDVEVAYLGWTGNGHIGRLNLSHAFYQVTGRESVNLLAGRSTTVNAQMAAAELSYDRDWLRYRGAFFWASGDANPRDGRARGFDSIVDAPVFAGGIFSLWNSQAIRLTGTGVALVGPNSLLPNLRPNKEEGKSNFVNPGIFIVNAGADVELTTKLRSIINVNFLRFDRTEPLELLLFQAPVRHTIGTDISVGFQYRPPLTENMVVTVGGATLIPGQGFADIYTRKTLFYLFSNLRLQF